MASVTPSADQISIRVGVDDFDGESRPDVPVANAEGDPRTVPTNVQSEQARPNSARSAVSALSTNKRMLSSHTIITLSNKPQPDAALLPTNIPGMEPEETAANPKPLRYVRLYVVGTLVIHQNIFPNMSDRIPVKTANRHYTYHEREKFVTASCCMWCTNSTRTTKQAQSGTPYFACQWSGFGIRRERR
jgi:hypothetical protein